MFRPRIIPVLLLKDNALYKSTNFKKYHYIGDPINAVKLFNDLKADELVFLDIMASIEKRTIDIELVKKIGEEANMPFAVGGGINSISQIKKIINSGAEKVIISSAAALNPRFIEKAVENFGSSTIVVCIDVKKKLFGGIKTWVLNGKKSTNYHPIDFAVLMANKGAGEIIIQSIERDGTMMGYDYKLISSVSKAVDIPVVALGGCNSINDMKKAHLDSNASALAAGSLFVYQGTNKGVLINYPETVLLYFLKKFDYKI